MRWIAMVLALALQVAYADDAKLERNKKAVLDFYDKGPNQKDFDAASKHFGTSYIQHNPGAADGPEGFKGFVEFLKAKFRGATSTPPHARSEPPWEKPRRWTSRCRRSWTGPRRWKR
jgi:hypothetical protein